MNCATRSEHTYTSMCTRYVCMCVCVRARARAHTHTHTHTQMRNLNDNQEDKLLIGWK